MLDEAQVRAIAREADEALRAARPLALFTDRYPGFDLPSGYAVEQFRHAERMARGAKPVGRKIAFTNPEMWALYGVREPLWAWMYDGTVRFLGAGCGRCALDGLLEPKIEPEIVVRFAAAPPPRGDLAALLESIEWVACGFEVVQCHFPGWKFRAPDALADGALHATLFVGEPRPVASLAADPVAALEAFSLELHCDGRLRETGRGGNVLGSPLMALAHLLGALSRQPEIPPLAAGEIVTTGTITAALPVRAGETWHTRVAGIALDGVRLEFGA